MDVISVNNESNSHFESDGVALTSSVDQNGNDGVTTKFDDRGANGERIRRKRKTRRFKSRYKNKSSSSKNPKYLKKMRSRSYPQSEAPNNTNEFLMADHDNIENLDEKIVVPEFARDGSRARESSFTSVDTDEYYSSPDNDEDDEYFTKDFDNTYQSVCAEKLVGLAKPQLAKIILDLESKVDELSKQINHRSNSNQMSDIIRQVNGIDNKELGAEIKDIIRENERLRNENEALQRFIKENAVTWSSSSSSSSADSDSDSSDTDAETTAAADNQNQRISASANSTSTGADDDPA
ncbi:snRNA binding [Sarracenia purpurea var. burkii]